MSKGVRATSGKPLTKKQKRQLDRLIGRLGTYLDTTEGTEVLTRMEDLFARIHANAKPLPPLLTEREERALWFIRKELKTGHSPTVREVARAVGLRSARSGMVLICTLIARGLLRRDGHKLCLVDSVH